MSRQEWTEKATADWCPATGLHVHRYSDWGGWVEHNHPECDGCGYIDTSRTFCRECETFKRDWVDRKIYHDNNHVWPGFAGEPDGGDYGGSDF